MAATALLGAMAWPSAARSCETVFAQLDNDFTLLIDEGYSNGFRIGCAINAPDWDGWQDTKLAIIAGHAIHTPANISRTSLDPHDQPFASHAYLQAALTAPAPEVFTRIDVQAGLIGPVTAGETIQKTIHKIGGFPHPRGWDHQIGHEATANLRMGRMWSIRYEERQMDWLPFINLNAGNVLTAASAGILLRTGQFAAGTYPYFNGLAEPPGTSSPELQDDDYFLFAGFEVRAVARDLFLDGRIFDDDHGVAREPAIGAVRFGGQTEWRGLGLGFVQTLHTSLFEGDDPHGYGAFYVSIGF